MKKIRNVRLVFYTFCLLFVILGVMLPMHSEAAEKINLKKTVTFTLFHDIDGMGESDVEYSIYRVGDVTASGKVSLTGKYAEYGLSFDETKELSLKNTAEALQGYIMRDKIAALGVSKTDANGVVVFPTKGTMSPGLYLITGKSYSLTDGSLCNIQPILLTLPTKDTSGSWMYDVKVESKYEILTNTSKISVLKVWDDVTTHYRPSEIQVELVNQNTGRVHDQVTLSKENNWRYTWKELPNGASWTVIEKSVPEYYTVSYEKDGFTVKITNTSDKTYTPPKAPEQETPAGDSEQPVGQNPQSPMTGGSSGKLPQTGTLWWPVPILAVAGILCMLIGMIRKRG